MQSEDDKTAAGQDVPPAIRTPLRYWTRCVDGLAALGTVMILFLMTIIVADVVARNMMGASLPLIAELGALTVVIIVFLQLGTAVRNDRLARTEFLLAAISVRWPRFGALIRCIWDIAGAFLCIGIAWSSWDIFGRDLAHREFIGVIGVLTLPTAPFRAFIFLGAAVAALQFLLMAALRVHQTTSAGDHSS